MHQKDVWAMLLICVARQIPVKIYAAECTQRFWRAATSHIDTWNIFWNIMKCTILFSYLTGWWECQQQQLLQDEPCGLMPRCQDLPSSQSDDEKPMSPGLGWQWTSFPNRGTGRAPDNVRDYGKQMEAGWNMRLPGEQWGMKSLQSDSWSWIIQDVHAWDSYGPSNIDIKWHLYYMIRGY